ncbi:MAG TPA: cytidylate kinase family protein, partial [Trueperaceae bacterium]|nr:cytidylate kinase family protein [Trueperaceae bacterium]
KRLGAVMAAEGLDRGAARRRIERTDAARRAYLRRLYDEDPNDARNYQLTLDVTDLSEEAAVTSLLSAVHGLRSEVGAAS